MPPSGHRARACGSRAPARLPVDLHAKVRECGVVGATVQVLALQDDAIAVPQQRLERGTGRRHRAARATMALARSHRGQPLPASVPLRAASSKSWPAVHGAARASWGSGVRGRRRGAGAKQQRAGRHCAPPAGTVQRHAARRTPSGRARSEERCKLFHNTQTHRAGREARSSRLTTHSTHGLQHNATPPGVTARALT